MRDQKGAFREMDLKALLLLLSSTNRAEDSLTSSSESGSIKRAQERLDLSLKLAYRREHLGQDVKQLLRLD